MDNTTEDDVSSSTANHSFSGSGAAASGESGWTTYIDYFMETQQHKEARGASTTTPSTYTNIGRSTSEHIGDHGGAGGAVASFAEEASRLLPALVAPSRVSKRLGFRKGEEMIRRKKVMYDESLEDTATSPISSPKVSDSRDSDDKNKNKEDACDDQISHCKKTTHELDYDKHTVNDNGAKSSTDMISDNEYDHNELRKKGLCLVPVTVFHV